MKISNFLACCICLSLLMPLTGCGAPSPASIKESGLKPINDLKYYPQLTESQYKKFAKTLPEAKPAHGPFDKDAM